jgi:putative PEP-CTERM system TPR-repeat lipoprotein
MMQRIDMNTKRWKCAALGIVLVAALVAGCSEKPEAMLASAKELLAKNDRNAAVIQLRNALQKNPDLSEARYVLGKSLYDSGDLPGAEKELRKANDLSYDPDNVTPLLARVMLQMGQFKKVISEFGRTRLDSPDSRADLQTTLAYARSYNDDNEGARSGFEAALKAKPGYPRAQVGLARLNAAAGDVPGATALVDEALAAEPNLTEGWQFKGEIASAQGRIDDALAAYRKAIETKPDYVPAHAMITTMLIQQNKSAEAAKALEEMKKVAPKHPQTFYLTALLAFRDGQYQAARDAIQQHLKYSPDNPLGLLLSARIDYQLGNFTQAESELKSVLAKYPRQPFARRLLVQTYLRVRQPGKAIEAMQPILEEGNLDADTLSLIGEAYAQNGDVNKASAYFERAAQLDPNTAGRRTTLALAHLAKGEGERGFRELEDAAAADPGIRADVALIVGYMQQKKPDAALKAVAALEKKQPENPLVYNLRGGILLSKGDTPGARQNFEKAASLDPGYYPAAANLARLDLNDKKPDEAKKRFDAVLAKNPKNIDALLALATLKAQAGGSTEEVAKLIGNAITADPNDLKARLALIGHYLRVRETKLAVTAAQDAMVALPDRPEILDAAGRAYLAAGNTNQAQTTYLRLAQLQPDSPIPLLRMAEVQLAARDRTGALENVRKALAMKPDLVEAQRMAIVLDVNAGKSAEALAMARDIQKQRPKESIGYVLEGDIRAKEKAWPDAIAAYRNGLKNAGTNDLAIRLTSALDASGNSAEAERFSASWLKDHPTDLTYRQYMGEIAIAKKNYPAAAKIYSSVLESQPNDVLALNNLAWVAGQLKDPKAIQYAEKAVSLAPDNPTVLDTLGMLLVDNGDTKKGVELLQKATKLAPDAAPIRLNLARALVKDGQKEGAKKELDTLAKLGDKFSDQAEVTKLMQGL